MSTFELIKQAQTGDEEAFTRLVDPYRNELRLHCYRFLGSIQDAEDALQETLLAAWRGIGRFAGRASIRTWLYRIATNRCLNALRENSRRPAASGPVADVDLPEPTRLGEIPWLEPYPDALLTDSRPGPDAQYETREAVSLAFVTALQLLPPRQRAVLILRDVLGFHASEVAGMLRTTEESVTSALKRARATLELQTTPATGSEPAPAPNSPAELKLVEEFVRAFENSDVDGLVALLTEDVWLRMPPVPFEYQGRERASRFLSAVISWQGPRPRLIATRANGQPAFGLYVRDQHANVLHAVGLLVMTLRGAEVCTLTRFEASHLQRFGLPRRLSG